MATAFDEVKPWPSPAPPMGHNKPPLDESVLADFESALRTDGVTQRIDDLIAAAGRSGACDSDEKAGRMAEYAKQCTAALNAIEAEREKHNRPLLTAQRALKGRADAIAEPLRGAARTVRDKVDGYMAEQRRFADERRREAKRQAAAARAAAAEEDARRRAAAAAEAGGQVESEPEPLVEVAPVEVETPVIRGDYGARVGSTTVWLHEIESVRKLPDSILKHEKVVEAINKVLAAQVRGGAREIKGVRIWSEQRTAIR